MTYDQVRMAAFRNELEKVAGELQGATRIGIKPIGVERMLEREREAVDEGRTPSAVFDMPVEEVVEKVAVSKAALKTLGLVAAGAGGYHVVRTTAQDAKMGRQIRKQQGY